MHGNHRVEMLVRNSTEQVQQRGHSVQNKGSRNTSTMASQSGKKIRCCLQDGPWTEGLHQGVYSTSTRTEHYRKTQVLKCCFQHVLTLL